MNDDSKATIRAEVEQIGPDRAEQLLGRMVQNRKIRPAKVRQFANDMTSGRWLLTGEAIKLTEDGRVIDGEHRLKAIIESGVAVTTLVIYGARLEDRVVMDTGTSRSLADHLSFMGEINCQELAASLTALKDRQSGIPWRSGMGGSATTSRQQYLDLLAEHPNIRQSVATVIKACRLLRLPSGIAAALHYDMATLDSTDAEDFWGRLYSGVDLPEHHPILVLRRRLEDNAASVGKKLERALIHAYIIKAWNAYREGREISIIRWTRGGANPEPFPTLI